MDGTRSPGAILNGAGTQSLGLPGNEESPRALYPQLRPHPGGHSKEQVGSHQRARIYGAMIRAVSEQGYGATTVRGLCSLAGVSTRTFYEHFPNKQECFLSTYDLVVRRAARRILLAQKGERDWRERLRLALRMFAQELEREKSAARLVLVESFAVGPRALERMRHASGVFEAMILRSFASAPDGIQVPPLVVRGIVEGIARLARARLLAGHPHELSDLTDELTEWVLCFRCGQAAALERMATSDEGSWATAEPAQTLGAAKRVRGDDRERILEATAQLAADTGYWQLTVPRIRGAAGVSRKSFDACFAGAHECFFAALEKLTERALAHAVAAGAAAGDWPHGLHCALVALTEQVAHDPVFAQVAFVEVFAPGPDGARYCDRAIASAGELLRASAPAAHRPGGLAAEASVGAVWGIVHHHVARGRASRLPQAAAVLSFLTLVPSIGGEAAIEAIGGEQAQGSAVRV